MFRFICILFVSSIWMLGAACGGEDGAGGNEPSTGGQPPGGGAPIGGDSTGGMGGTFNPSGGGDSGGADTCAAEEVQAETVPLNIIVLLDRSGSMAQPVDLWTPVEAALNDFFSDPNSAGINVSMSFFPIDSPPDNNTCNISHYDPAHVPFTDIPANASVLASAISAENPLGTDTPTYGALYGTLQQANAYQDLHLDEVVVVVLASDGDPNGCTGTQNDPSTIAGIAQIALNYNGVRTFVIAIQGANVANLDIIAAGGGTGQAFDVTGNTSQFKQKMEEIREQLVACEFVIPAPTYPDEFDPLKVNVEYTPGGSNTPEEFPQADNLQDCGDEDGWYYDDPINPTKVFLCPKSCERVQLDTDANVKILFGCPTRVN